MTETLLDRLLRGAWIDPDSGVAVAPPIRAIVVAQGVRHRADALVGALGLGRRLAVVMDPTTASVLGDAVARALAGVAEVAPVRLPEHPHADAGTVARIRAATAACDALVAVGSGTINDLCKYAAFLDRKPYLVFATAPSMNGYTSANAAITVDGHKKSLAAQVPQGVFVDLDVLAAAPQRMIRAGIGDSLCRPTAQADWLLSHLLLDTPYRAAPFAMLAEDEPALLDRPEAAVAGDVAAVGSLARTLVLSGLGMTHCGGSYPASQGEHLISHFIESLAPADAPPAFHGEQVAVATMTMARLQQAVLAGPAPVLAPTAMTEAELARRIGPEAAKGWWADFAPKMLDRAAADRLNARLQNRWGAIGAALRAVAVSPDRLARALDKAGVPRTPAAIGIDQAFYRKAVTTARFQRNRYTFLDLADDSGRLAEIA
ncbi:MAG: sn-glycerol-1-phosphate dehydrogenase [Rhodospirillales bacterium]|nr:sn-glycerol-1-phosphate dehydrogenase [Rhodospirillales bacterium]